MNLRLKSSRWYHNNDLVYMMYSLMLCQDSMHLNMSPQDKIVAPLYLPDNICQLDTLQGQSWKYYDSTNQLDKRYNLLERNLDCMNLLDMGLDTLTLHSYSNLVG